MELTYSGNWYDATPENHALEVGDYTAHVYRAHKHPDRPNWAWWVRWEFPADDGEWLYDEIAHGIADDVASARAAVEDAIRRHHAERFSTAQPNA